MRTFGLLVLLASVSCSSGSPSRSDPQVGPMGTSENPRQSAPQASAIAAAPVDVRPNTTAASSVAPNPAPEASSAPEPDELPDPDTTLALGNGTFVVELSSDFKRDFPDLAIELQREKKSVVRREGWKTITHVDLKKIHPCEIWSTRLSRELIGKINAVRLSLICRVGEDFLTSTEIAVLLDPDDLKTIWAGPADEWINSMDSCIFSRRVTFKGINPKTIEKTILESTIWSEQLIEEGAKARLKRDCKVGSKRRVERVVLP